MRTLFPQKPLLGALPTHLGLLAATVVLVTAAQAQAADLDGFKLESQADGSLAVKVQGGAVPAYDVEPSGNGVNIILKDTRLSESLKQRGMPVVIDNRNRAIGRAVPGEGNTVKIVIPNWKPSQGAISVQADSGESPSSARAGIEPRQPAEPTSPRVKAPAERLSGAFQSQFKTAAQALNQSESTTLSLPAVETPTSPRSAITTRKPAQKKRYKAIPVSSAASLPKVVSWNDTVETATAQAPAPQQPAIAQPSPAPTTSHSAINWSAIAQQQPPTPESTGWGSYGTATSETENPYGITTIADAAEAAAPGGTSIGTQLKHFFDGITGNRFSKPYGVAFWAMMIGVIFIACLGFLALAIGLLCTRLVFTPFNKSKTLLNPSPEETPSQPVHQHNKPLGPLAKRFPFVASGLSDAAPPYTPRRAPLNPRRQAIEIPEPTVPPVFQRLQNFAQAEAPIQPRPQASVTAPTRSGFRPHIGMATQAPTQPSFAMGLQTSSTPTKRPEKTRTTSATTYKTNDADLLSAAPTQGNATSIERALSRLSR